MIQIGHVRDYLINFLFYNSQAHSVNDSISRNTGPRFIYCGSVFDMPYYIRSTLRKYQHSLKLFPLLMGVTNFGLKQLHMHHNCVASGSLLPGCIHNVVIFFYKTCTFCSGREEAILA